MRELDAMRIMGPDDGEFSQSPRSRWRELIAASETSDRWRLGEVAARPDEGVSTHIHPGEAEALIILDGEIELHGAEGMTRLRPGDIVYVPPDTEHALRTPQGGRWLAIWPVQDRLPGKRYGG